jgi:hypothetical protein
VCYAAAPHTPLKQGVRSKGKIKMKESDKERLDFFLLEAAKIIRQLRDMDVPELLGDGILDTLLKAIAEPKTNRGQTIYEYLLANKHRLQLLAVLRLAIHRNYSIKGKVRNTDVWVSPNHIQWYDNGVMFLQGGSQFEGLIGLYEAGRVKFGVAKRDIMGGENIGPDDLEFIDVEELEQRSRQPSVPRSTGELENAINELQLLLQQKENDESVYQDYISKHPWVLGAQYRRVDSHVTLDDENIPDFTGVRVRDSARDIIEIKSPFLPLFKGATKSFRAEFHNAWSQAERYLDFTRQEAEYLKRQKGLFFDNPKCYLILGHDLTDDQLKEIRRKERMNPTITILTYKDLLAMARSTVNFVKALKN